MTWMLDKTFLEALDLATYDPQAISKRLGLDLATVARFVDAKRRYRVQTNLEYGWVAGKRGDGQPTLAFVGRPRISSSNVEALNSISFDWATNRISTAAIAIDDEDGLDDSEYVLGMLEDEIGFVHTEQTDVFAFKYPGLWHYAVVPFPFHFHDIALGLVDDDGDLALTRDWVEGEKFVLQSGNSYFMSKDGDVESS